MLILMSSALKSEMKIFVVVIAVKMIEVMQVIVAKVDLGLCGRLSGTVTGYTQD